MAIVVRDAREKDIDAIYTLGSSDTVFQVSKHIPFYEREELTEWINNPKDNILCVADDNGNVIGFFFCKVMSWHWAMLDNFYCVPSFRNGKISSLMTDALIQRLRQRKVLYLSTLVEEGRISLGRFLRRQGFSMSKRYEWYEVFIK